MAESKTRKINAPEKIKISNIKSFLCDASKPEMYYGALVRSPSAFGKITNINFGNLPDGYFFYTARDIPGKNWIYTLNQKTRVFCNETVHYEGEPVGILVGPDIKTVRALTDEITITFDISTINTVAKNISENYTRPFLAISEIEKDNGLYDMLNDINIMPSLDSLPKPSEKISYTNPDQIKKISANQRKNNLKTQEILAVREIKNGWFEKNHTETRTEEFFKSFDINYSDSYIYNDKNPKWIETSGALAYQEGKKLIITSPSRWPSNMILNTANVLGIEPNIIEIKRTQTQKTSENGTWRTSVLGCQASLACLLSGHPVKLVLTHKEQDLFMNPGMEILISIHSGSTKEGLIKALEINIEADAGYTNPFAQEIADRLAIAAKSFYSVPNLHITVTVKNSSNPPTSINPGTIDPAAFFALENHISALSSKNNLFPDEVRLMNMHKKEAVMFYKNLKIQDSINAIVNQSDFHRKHTSFRRNAKQIFTETNYIFQGLPRRGIGLSQAFDGSYFFGTIFKNSEPKMQVTLTKDSTLQIDSPEPSNSITEIWKKIASEQLQLDPSFIQISEDSNNNYLSEKSLPENMTCNISIMTNLLKKCLSDIQKKRFHTPLPIISKKGLTPAIKKQWNHELFDGTPYFTSSYGTCIVETEINPNTYKLKINGIWLAIDCGEILSLKSAENAVRLQISRELENLMQHETISSDLIKINFVQSNNPPCQIGSLIHKILPPAFTSAVAQSISSCIDSIPCSDEKIFLLSERAIASYEIDKLHEELNDNIEDLEPLEQEKETES